MGTIFKIHSFIFSQSILNNSHRKKSIEKFYHAHRKLKVPRLHLDAHQPTEMSTLCCFCGIGLHFFFVTGHYLCQINQYCFMRLKEERNYGKFCLIGSSLISAGQRQGMRMGKPAVSFKTQQASHVQATKLPSQHMCLNCFHFCRFLYYLLRSLLINIFK